MTPPGNPFTSRRLRPGAVPYLEPSPGLVDELAARFVALPRGQILGPHGSGKSALLAALVAELRRRGWSVATFELRAGERRLPVGAWRDGPRGLHGAVAIDGFEQLSWLTRWRARWTTWRRQTGMLVTTHAPAGLPTLYVTSPSLATAQRIAAQLQTGYPALISPSDVTEQYARLNGDVRETLFALYDLYEARRRD